MNKHLLVSLLLASGCGSAAAQVFEYDWESPNSNFTNSDADWETPWVEHDVQLPNGIVGASFGSNQIDYHGIFAPLGDERVSGTIFGNPGANYQTTMVHADHGVDLSASGASFTIHQWYAPGKFHTPTTITTPNNQLLQMGLVANSSGGFADTSVNSLWLGGLETGFDTVNETTTLEHGIYDQSNVASVTSGTSPVYDFNGGTGTVGTFDYYEYTLTFTNTGASTFDVGVDVDKWQWAVVGDGYVETDASFFNDSYSNVSHSFSATELADLRVGLGNRIEDYSTVTVSGANYDGMMPTVPEPSAAMLGLLAGVGLGLRRRRRRA